MKLSPLIALLLRCGSVVFLIGSLIALNKTSAFASDSDAHLATATAALSKSKLQLDKAQALQSIQSQRYPTRPLNELTANVMELVRVRAPAYGVNFSTVQAGADVGVNIPPATLNALSRKVVDGETLTELPISMSGSYRDIEGLKLFLEEFAQFSTSVTHLTLEERDIRRITIVIIGVAS